MLTVAVTSAVAPAKGGRGDPLREQQWGLAQIQAEAAWRYSTGKGVTIAIVDSGVDRTAPDLKGKVVFARGGNLTCTVEPRTCTTGPSDASDDQGHGTWVAGIAAARADDGVGIAGVAPDAKILAVKVMDMSSGHDTRIGPGIRFAADRGARVINLSLSLYRRYAYTTTLPNSDAVREAEAAAAYAWRKGSVVVAAAGNDPFPLCDVPAIVPHILCVGALDHLGVKAWYSAFGEGLDLVAPGGSGPFTYCSWEINVWGPASSTGQRYPACGDVPGFIAGGGTSGAAPHVSGVAALLFAKGYKNAEVVRRLTMYADDLGVPGHDPIYGFGRVNALRALRGR